LVAAGWTIVEDQRANGAMAIVRSTIPNATDTGEVDLLKRLARGGQIAPGDLAQVEAFVGGRNDCSDFRLITLLRAAYAYGSGFTPEVEARVRALAVGFPYWMDQPGGAAMVHWSENHQILFAADEFLAGQRYAHAAFADGRTGAQHQGAARSRILFWLDQRWRFGFSEWNSHYYVEDIAALSNLIDFAHDDEIVRKATIVLDLLLLDMASQTVRGEFITTSGRLYEGNKKFGDPAVRRIVRHAFLQPVAAEEATGLEINFLMSRYATPPVLAAMARDPRDAVVRSSTGRNLDELRRDRTLSTSERRIMALWGMEAFTNPEAISSSLAYIRAHGLFSNPFLAPFRRLNYRVIRATGALPILSVALDLPTNGTVLERANTYTVRMADYAMSTAQAYRPGQYGNQDHIFGLTLDQRLTVFHTHPAVLPGEAAPNGNSPGYWTGTGQLPLSCQDGSINLSLYHLPVRAGLGRRPPLAFTHLYAPFARFDRVALQGNRLILKYGSTLVAVTGRWSLERKGDSEVIQRGRDTFWITEASSTRQETFEAFSERIRTAAVGFDGRRLTYRSGGRWLSADLKTGCGIDGAPLQTAYPRHESKYGRVERDPSGARYSFAGHSLTLDFGRMIRKSD